MEKRMNIKKIFDNLQEPFFKEFITKMLQTKQYIYELTCVHFNNKDEKKWKLLKEADILDYGQKMFLSGKEDCRREILEVFKEEAKKWKKGNS